MAMEVTRRGFLAVAGAAAVGVAAKGAGGATPMGPEKPEKMAAPTPAQRRLGIAVVGLGKLAVEEILPAIVQTERCRVTGLVTGHKETKGKVLAEKYGVRPEAVYGYEEYERMRENPEIEAVYIVLPNALHAEFTVRAAQAGKHVLCEKPMATSSAECLRMIDACREAGRKLMIAYRIQYEPHHRKVRELVQTRELGAAKVINAVNTQNQASDTWRTVKKLAGGGSLPDIGLYCLNTARFVLGEEPVEVEAYTWSDSSDRRFAEVEDVMQFVLRFPSGAVLNAISSYSAADRKAYDAMCEKGVIAMDPAFPYRGLKLKVTRGEKEGKEKCELEIREMNQFALEMDHFARGVLENQMIETPGEEGLRDQQLMEVIYEAARTGRRVQVPGRGPSEARE